MELNRNQFMMIGLLVLLLGLQFRMVDHFVLNAKATEIVEKKLNKNASSEITPQVQTAGGGSSPLVGNRMVKPPHWLGWCLVSVGGVLVLHSLAMRRPG
jgi:hypothetical protein